MTSNDAKRMILIVRYTAIALVAVLVIWLVKQDVVLSGRFEVAHDYRSPSPFFTELVPKQRVILEESGSRFTAEPVYTTLRYPRPFQRLDLTVAFENPEDLFVEIGPQVGLPEQYELHGLNHPGINEVFAPDGEWEQTDALLHQRKLVDYRYENLEQLHGALPEVHKTAYYGVDWPEPFLPNFSEDAPDIDSSTPLRGRHTFLLATNRDSLNIELQLRDINLDAGEDPVTLTLSDWWGNELDREALPDDGETRERGVTSGAIEASVGTAQITKPGVYVLELETTDDLILTSLKANTPYMVAKNRLHLAGGRAYLSEFGENAIRAVPVQTSVRSFTAMTDDRETLQTLRTAREVIPLEEPFEEHRFSLPADRRFLLDQGYTVVVEEGNVRLVGRGVFALNAGQYFSPYPWYADQTLDLDGTGIDYLIADYRPPMVQEDGTFISRLDIDLGDVFAPTRALRMQFSLPGMQDRQSFVVHSLSAVYTSEPVTWSNAIEKLRRFIDREF